MSSEPVRRYVVRHGVYYDSLVLMGLHAALADQEGVVDAGAVMASPTNLELLEASGLLPDTLPELAASDLLVVTLAVTTTAGDEALAGLDELLRGGDTETASTYVPRSLRAALRQLPQADWAVISVPGEHATATTRDALHLGLNAFLYSDNVGLGDEVELKQLAAERDLLVLGPDCGTAILDGVGLGFANRVRRGPVGLVGASGTGLQAITVALDRLGSGVSEAIGTGGRDLSREVGGATATRALERLAGDPDTSVIVLISKRPEPAVADRLLIRAADLGKPVVIYFQGDTLIPARPGLHPATSLRHAALIAQALVEEVSAPSPPQRPPADAVCERHSYVRGLFGGGTLAAETLWQLHGRLDDLHSNLDGPWDRLASDLSTRGHAILDLGDDALTRGRPHPMIDPRLQAERLTREGASAEVGTLVLDVILGDGAHADPAGILAPAIRGALVEAAAQGRRLEIIALLIGTPEDPQGLDVQAERLADAGAAIVADVEELVALILGAPADPAPTRSGVLPAPTPGRRAPRLVNLGLEPFHHSLAAQGAEAIHVDWRPPAGGDVLLATILERLKARERQTQENAHP